MKKVYWLSILFTFSFRLIFSQTNYQHGFLPVDANADEKKSQPDYQLYKQQLHKKYDTLFERVEDCNKFVKLLVTDLRNNFENGEIYCNWDYAQAYVNKVFKAIIPGANPDSINIKIIRSTEINAFMTGSGQAYITVGFLANMLNEAEIASTLGHEYGHYIHLDSYKSFKEYLKAEKKVKIGNMFAGAGGNLFSLMAASNMYDALRDMEREADKTGTELAKQTGYNLLAWVDVQRRFKVIEDNAHKDKDYKRGFGFYFRTHPPTKERIEYTQKAANASDTINTKYFLVDENMFSKIKMQAVDESINLLLQQMDYEDCIALCYKQLLFYPNDEFYLFYLNEALRRFMLVSPKEADNFFITGRYNTAVNQLPKNKLPVYINSQMLLKNTDFRVPKTIFYHYEYLMLADNNRIFVTLPDNSLTRTDTLEFVTNADALKYFIALQEKLKQSSVNWVKNCQTNTVDKVEIKSDQPFLNKYNGIKKDVLTFVSGAEQNTTMPCILSGINYWGTASFVTRSDFKSDYLYEQCGYYLNRNLNTPFNYFDFKKTISPSEKNAFTNFMEGVATTARGNAKKTREIKKISLPLTLLTPEILAILTKYKLQQFMVVGMHVEDGLSVSHINFALTYSLTFYMYCIDVKNGFLSYTTEKQTIGSASDIEYKVQKLNQSFPLLQYKK